MPKMKAYTFLMKYWTSIGVLEHTLSRIIKRQVLTNSMVAILTFWSTTDSDHVRAVPVALLSITINHSGARFWPQKEKTSASTFFSLSFVMIFFSQKCRQFKISKIRQITRQKSPIDVFYNEKQPFLGEFSKNWHQWRPAVCSCACDSRLLF